MDRQVSELRKNEALRQELKREIFGRLLGHRVGSGYPRVYVEREDGDFEVLRTDVPTDAREVNPASGQIAPRAYLDTLVGTWLFVEEPAAKNVESPRPY